ncbi:MAG TPA: hypothetical protein VKG82_06060 [Solirubrobacteraceae bacterium]|nr:hypothetical protein [Solirubrobacteraceae bacterium]
MNSWTWHLIIYSGLWVKSRQEEKLMSEHFPGAYADYTRRVHSLIPFAL